jgi:hypothetical protein
MSYTDSTDSVNAQILDKISEYFLNLSRIDRIPKLDIIRELSTMLTHTQLMYSFYVRIMRIIIAENMKISIR